MKELKPCPFCGSDAEMHFDRLCGKTIYMVKCSVDKCQCQEMGWHETEDEAIAIWNTRPIEDALRKRVEELESLLSHERLVGVVGNILGKYDFYSSYYDELIADIAHAIVCKEEQ